MANISNVINKVKESNLELGSLFENFILNESINFHFDNYELFGNQLAGVSLRSGIYLNNSFLDMNRNQAILAVFIILHECGHFKRYDSIDYDVVSLTKFPIDEYLKKCEIEENYANNFSLTVMESWIEKIKDVNFKNILGTLIKQIESQTSKFDPKLYIKIYNVIKENIKNYKNGDELILAILKKEIELNENKIMKSNEDIIRKKIAETIKQLFENPEIAPAQPKIKPDVKPAPAQPNPRRILKPIIHPGAKPQPKAKSMEELKKKVKLKELYYNFFKVAEKKFLLEAPMNYEDPKHQGPDPAIKKNIETRGTNPFSKIDVLHKINPNNQTSLERLGDEEYQDVVDTAKKHKTDNTDYQNILNKLEEVIKLQAKHKSNLEQLAKNTVQKYFGIPDDVMDEIIVELKNDFSEIDFELDDYMDESISIQEGLEELINDFTPEEQLIIKQNVDKRIIANALMMGAGFKAHNLLEKVKPVLDAIEPKLFQLYLEIMSGHAYNLWKHAPSEEHQIQYLRKKIDEETNLKKTIQNLKIAGKSELILGDDENGDGIREVKGARAVAIIFPVLLHETVKAIMEYVFANGLPQYTKRINREIMKQAEKFHYEHWHKLLGPRLWKYLHDAIDYIVKARDSDYTIVAYLLQEIAMLPPNKFLRLIDLLLHDGATAVIWLEKMLDRVEEDLANQDIDNEPVPQADFGNINNLMGQIQNMINQPEAQKKPEPIQQKNFNQMTTEELQNFIISSINAGDFDKAAEARDELERRGE